MTKEQDKKNYKDTLNLPRTDFPIRANPKEEDKIMLERWEQEDMYRKTFLAHEGKEKFILHDGPPYANGNIHLGHALNKILKDMVCKSQRMFDKQVPVTPGWDCHGLPIELKVTLEHGNLDRIELKKLCRAYAQKWIDIQREEFKKLGVFMDWENAYLTMDFSYEASILRAFGVFVEKGYIERSNKTVPWCASCQTVLASAEIEYADRKDPSVYVLFPLSQEAVAHMAPQLKDKAVNLLVWTTTPWTLPLNRAVLLKPDANYVVLDIEGTLIVTAEKLADKVVALKQVPKNIVATFNTNDIASGQLKAYHPFIQHLNVPIILDQSVSLEDGSAVVHCAPGCGPEDYAIGIKNHLEIYSPITADGKYTDTIQPQALQGMPVSEGQWWILRTLQDTGFLFHKTTITHAYPHCWRCHQGLIFRATKQWFCDLSKHNLKQRTLEAIDKYIKTIPEKSINRLRATLEGRLEWCLSRQRIWGVPIPAIIHDKTDYVYVSKEFIDKVAYHIMHEGIEWWDKVDIKDLLPDTFDFDTYPLDELRKEQDILDVWFESGVSFYAVLLQRKELGFPADMYLEGSDQHRAWFQSSLLISMVLEEMPPMKQIMTHGFTVDDRGRKMSKSIGNVIAPSEMIESLGTDGLRLWVSSIDTSGDAVVSPTLMTNVKEVYRKIRNTARFLLSNIYDFDVQRDAIDIANLMLIDRHALQELYIIHHKILHAYQQQDFTAIFHLLADYVTSDLSSFYLDIVKDRLYVEYAAGSKRRSAQTACWFILDTLTRLMAPILSFTAEQVSDHYQTNKDDSIHLQKFTTLSDSLAMFEGEQKFVLRLKELRSVVLKAIELLRETGVIKHSLEARVALYIDKDVYGLNIIKDLKEQLTNHQTAEDFLRELFIVSQCTIQETHADLQQTTLNGVYVFIEHALGTKCPRCWQWQETEHVDNLCSRCDQVIKEANNY